MTKISNHQIQNLRGNLKNLWKRSEICIKKSCSIQVLKALASAKNWMVTLSPATKSQISAVSRKMAAAIGKFCPWAMGQNSTLEQWTTFWKQQSYMTFFACKQKGLKQKPISIIPSRSWWQFTTAKILFTWKIRYLKSKEVEVKARIESRSMQF